MYSEAAAAAAATGDFGEPCRLQLHIRPSVAMVYSQEVQQHAMRTPVILARLTILRCTQTPPTLLQLPPPLRQTMRLLPLPLPLPLPLQPVTAAPPQQPPRQPATRQLPPPRLPAGLALVAAEAPPALLQVLLSGTTFGCLCHFLCHFLFSRAAASYLLPKLHDVLHVAACA